MKYFVFSIDVEDWFQVENLKHVMLYEDWPNQELRINENIKVVLDILKRHNVIATFFVLGWIAERKPELVRRIADGGHEIASHGYKHELLHTINDTALTADIKKSLDILGPLSRDKILGYRAPSFSITRAAIHCLQAMELIYDASLNDFQFNKRYGKIATRSRAVNINNSDYTYTVLENGLIEFPISGNTYFNVYWPLGGGYFRLSPIWFLRKQLHDILEKSDIMNIYLHPWEFDSAQPRVSGLSRNFFFRHYYGLDKTAYKFEHLVELVKNTPGIEIRTFGEIAKIFAGAS